MSKATKRHETAMDFLGDLDDKQIDLKQYLPTSSLKADPDQPRKVFDQDSMNNLIFGIKSDGILQPLLVRESGGNPPYIITDGERRWRAAQALSLDEVPCLVRNDIDTKRIRFVQAMANANRENLSDYELAVVIQQQMSNNTKLKQKDMAKQLGISPSTVTRLLALLEPEYVDLARAGMIENASTLAQLKKLDDVSKSSVMDSAYNGKIITRDVIEERKIGMIAKNSDVGNNFKIMPDIESHHGEKSDISDKKISGGKQNNNTISVEKKINITLKIEDLELLIPYFSNKKFEELNIKMDNDIAIGLLENLGKTIPDKSKSIPEAIKMSVMELGKVT